MSDELNAETLPPGMTCDGCRHLSPSGACRTHPIPGRPCNQFSTSNTVLDALEGMARNHCYLDTATKTYQGASETNVTDSGGLSADAEALRLLARHGRFRVERASGRMVVGYWPEHDPKRKEGKT